MKDLLSFLKLDWEHKTPFIAFIMAALTFMDSSGTLLFSAGTIVVANMVASVLLLIGKAVAPTGNLPKGWSTGLWITNIGSLVIEIGNYLVGTGEFNGAFALTVAQITVAINGIIAGAQVYFSEKKVTV